MSTIEGETTMADEHDERGDEGRSGDPLVVDLGAEALGPGGAVWSLPHGGDLDANLIRLDPGAGIGAHVNDDVDVLLFVRSGSGSLTFDNQTVRLEPDHLAWIPRGSRRSITAGHDGISYLSVHRRRQALAISHRHTTESTS